MLQAPTAPEVRREPGDKRIGDSPRLEIGRIGCSTVCRVSQDMENVHTENVHFRVGYPSQDISSDQLHGKQASFINIRGIQETL